MVDRTLRREQLVLFISQEIETPASLVQSKVGLLDYYYKTLRQLRSGFDEVGETLTAILGAGTSVRPMTDLEHFAYYKRFLNPPGWRQRRSISYGAAWCGGLCSGCWSGSASSLPGRE